MPANATIIQLMDKKSRLPSSAQPNECVICGATQKSNTPKGYSFLANDSVLYFCHDHAESFKVGFSLGQIELNAKVVGYLNGINEKSTLAEIKRAIFEISPATKKLIKQKVEAPRSLPTTAQELYDELCNYIVGQELAKTNVSVSVIQHLWKIQHAPIQSVVPDKHNILMLGPSGSGKTLIGNSVAHILKLPFATGDATNYSPTGFHGQDGDSVIHDLFLRANQNVLSTQQGIVFIDELDKLAKHHVVGSQSEFLNFGTQASLLKLIEGKTVKIPGPVYGEPMGTSVDVDTSNILFLFGGAFNGLSEIVGKLSGSQDKKIGFRSPDASDELEEAIKNYEILSSASTDILYQALIDYGLLAELVGRIPTIVPLQPLNKIQLRSCLMDLEHSPIKKINNIFMHSGFKIEFDDALIDQIIDKAYVMATGTRALASLIKKVTSIAAFRYITTHKVDDLGNKIIFTAETLNDPYIFKVEPIHTSVVGLGATNVGMQIDIG